MPRRWTHTVTMACLPIARLKSRQTSHLDGTEGTVRNGFLQLYHFKSKFPVTLALATAVYPAARIEVTEEGLVL